MECRTTIMGNMEVKINGTDSVYHSMKYIEDRLWIAYRQGCTLTVEFNNKCKDCDKKCWNEA